MVIHNLNINPQNIRLNDVTGDGNCLYRSIARFVYGNEDLHQRVRFEIYEEEMKRRDSYHDITLETENGTMNIREYVNNINTIGFYGGELEIGITSELYNINIATYNEILNNNNEIIGLTPIRYYNHNDNNINRHLIILSNINNIHFRIWYYNNNNLEIDNNFKINPNEICPINKENNENNNANSNQDTKEINSIIDNHEFNKLKYF